MNRRKFIRNTALMSTPLFFKGVPVFAGGAPSHPLLGALSKVTNSCNKVLVIIQLNGGNDGLNMVIPLDKYTELTAARSAILIPASSVLHLNGTLTTGLHPMMTDLQSMYNNGKVTIVQGVSYPNPNFSHFNAQDIWFTGSTAAPSPDTGWLGRELDTAFPSYPNGYPNAIDPDPLAIQIGGATPLSLQGPNVNMSYNVSNPAALLSVVNAVPSPAPASDYGTELTFLRLMKDQSNAYAGRITASYNAQATMSTMYPASGNSLADQLKIVARLIGGGLNTTVYVVNHPDSFDTHVNQVTTGSTATGGHATSLSRLSVAIAAFQNDITLMGKANKVTGMTFSEFGRRVISNTSTGTDHGAAAPVIFFGAGVNGGIIGTSPNLPAAPTSSTQVPTQYDFRQLYTSVMQNWLCMSSTQSQTILGSAYSTLPVFNPNVALPVKGLQLNGAWNGAAARLEFIVQDNPAYESFVIERSFDARTFEPAGAMGRTSLQVTETYVFEDARPANPVIYYRIRALGVNGLPEYSNVLKLTNGATAQALTIYPNPVTNHTVNLDFFRNVEATVSVAIYDDRGAKIYANDYPVRGRILQLSLPHLFAMSTMYVMKVTYGDTQAVERIMFES